MNSCEFYLEDLKTKFNKINPKDYYLSYSGGRDSHLLLWFIKEYAKIDGIAIIGGNTYLEHPEILKRIKENSDRVLLPTKKPFQIKEEYGIPCFSKEQDFFIYYYQKALKEGRSPSRTVQQKVDRIYPSGYGISKTASIYVKSGNAHRISHLCCKYMKKRPFKLYERETGKKVILGIRGSESFLRRTQYTSCFTSKGKFIPLFDLSDELLNDIIKKYEIEVPKIYDHLNRTGCMGCPYGSFRKSTQKELELISEQQKKFVVEYFKESYIALNILPS